MKVAVIADVHANLPALERVMRHAQTQGVQEFWNLGDMVGYGPFPNECIAILQKACKHHIYGNHDVKALSASKIERMKEKRRDPDKIFSFEWTNQHLSADSIAFIRSLPSDKKVSVSSHDVFLSHGSPAGTEDSLMVDTPAERLIELSKMVKEKIVLCGHTHRFFDRTEGGVRFINPGGAGRSFDGDPRASYTILNFSNAGVAVEHFRLEYDVDFLAREMRAFGFPARVVRSLVEARSLEDLDLASVRVDPVSAALEIGQRQKFEKPHSLHVTTLALKMFDELQPALSLTAPQRLLLQVAGILHDIGYSEDPSRHHKIARDCIIDAPGLGLSPDDTVMAALIARYHRGKLPQDKHRYFKDLTADQKKTVQVCAGILRVADGLDRSHRGVVKDLTCKLTAGSVVITIDTAGAAEEEIRYGLLKGDLLQTTLGRTVTIRQKR